MLEIVDKIEKREIWGDLRVVKDLYYAPSGFGEKCLKILRANKIDD